MDKLLKVISIKLNVSEIRVVFYAMIFLFVVAIGVISHLQYLQKVSTDTANTAAAERLYRFYDETNKVLWAKVKSPTTGKCYEIASLLDSPTKTTMGGMSEISCDYLKK